MKRLFFVTVTIIAIAVITTNVQAERYISDDLIRRAEQGVTSAQIELGLIYSGDMDTKPNGPEAVKWLSMAANKGNANGQLLLGLILYLGRGVPHNEEEAVMWFRKAALQGDPGAQRWLGEACWYGQGTAKNVQESVALFQIASRQGDAESQVWLGKAYLTGTVVEKDLVHAYAWTSAGESNGAGNGGAQRRIIEQRLTPEQLQEAQKLASTLAKEYKSKRNVIRNTPMPTR